MRLGLKPDGLLERVALWLNLGPVPIAQSFFGMMAARVIMAGVKLGVYEALVPAPLTAEDLAARLKLDRAGATQLLNALCSVEVIRRRGDRYVLAPRARRWLDPASPQYCGSFLAFNYAQWDWWTHVEETIASGRSFEIHDYPADDPRWRSYILAMFELARLGAPEIARRLPLPKNAKAILDVAGAHGWFSAKLCRRHPGLSATVLELPGSAKIGRELIAKAGMADRVHHVDGNAFEHPLGGPYDGALCFQLVHHFPPEKNVELFKRIASAVRPGGTLAVLEFLVPKDGQPEPAGALLGLHYFLTSTAQTYRLSEVKQWLDAAGFRFQKAVPVRRMPMQTLVIARRREEKR